MYIYTDSQKALQAAILSPKRGSSELSESHAGNYDHTINTEIGTEAVVDLVFQLLLLKRYNSQITVLS